MKSIYSFILFFISLTISAQSNPNSVPTYFGCKTNKITDLTKKEIISNSLLHISSKVDTIFLKRMNMRIFKEELKTKKILIMILATSIVPAVHKSS